MTYSACFRAVSGLGEDIKSRIVSLYLDHYDQSDREMILSDLSTKHEILLLYYHQQLIGFTTLQYYRKSTPHGPIQVVYSGDTVVDRRHWGQQTMACHWIARMGQISRHAPQIPLYWFLIVKGHRTYKFLPVFCKEFYPHWQLVRQDLKELLDELAEEKFSDWYNKHTDLIEYPTSRGQLKGKYANPASHERHKPAVRYFLEKNPNYRIGWDLACLCELTESNLKPFAKRIFLRACA